MTGAYEVNGQRVDAAAFYAVACDPRRSVAVEACAGAGKTWMLVSRILRALLDGAAAHEILAITFTKRAAAEMRERLFTLLRDGSRMDASELSKELSDRGVLSTPESHNQLSNLYQSVLQNDRQVQVRTFHSWFGALLRNAPLAVLEHLQLPAQYELLEDDSDAKAMVWLRFHAALLADTAPARNLHADYLALVQQHGRHQTEAALSAALDSRQEFAAADVGDVLRASVAHFTQQFPDLAGCAEPHDYLRQHAQCWTELVEVGRLLGRAAAPSHAAQGALLEQAWSAGDAAAALAALLTKDGKPRKFGDKIVGIDRIRTMQELALRLKAADAQHAAWQHQQRMVALTRLLIEQYSAIKRQRGWVDMADVERAAAVLLSDPVLSGWVQQRLDARVSHLLIDEFQDTSPIQWQALSAWLSAYAGAGAGRTPTVFLVGDPKQSIYRFRRAEPQVFIAAQRFVREGLGGDVLSCDHTRRNASQVIAAVNQVMQAAVQGREYPVYRTHTTASDSAGRVWRLPQVPRPAKTRAHEAPDSIDKDGGSDGTDWRDSLTTPQTTVEDSLHEQEAKQAARWVAAQIATGRRSADIMVLARTRAALSPMQDALRQLGVPALLAEKARLIDTCEVQDVVALLDVLVSPQHDMSLARALKSPIFGWSDDDLIQMALAARQHPGLSWFDVLQKKELFADVSRNLWLSSSLKLKQWQSWTAQLPPHDALQSIYSADGGQGDLLVRYAAAAPAHLRESVLNNLQALLGVALDVGGGRFATPYALVRWLKAGHGHARTPASPDVVRLLTIHGAKGLEADLVLLLDSARTPNQAESMGVLVDWPGEAPRPRRLVFLASEARPPACAVDLVEREQTERHREELNALYVAMTRARQALVVSSVEPHLKGKPTWWSRLQAASDEAPGPSLDQRVEGRLETGGSAGIFQFKTMPFFDKKCKQLATENVAYETSQNTSEDASSGISSDASLTGQAMHRLLQWGRVDAASSIAAGREFFLTAPQRLQAQQAAERILQGEGAWAWDKACVSWWGDEVELHFEDTLLRLDRLVLRVNEDGSRTWWVLDHKSSAHPQEDETLVAQLVRYRRAVTALLAGGDTAQVRAAFLTADGRMVEVA